MALVFDQGIVRFDGHCVVEDAMKLLEIFQTAPEAQVDLTACQTMHMALLQVLVAARPRVVASPANRTMADLIHRMIGDPA